MKKALLKIRSTFASTELIAAIVVMVCLALAGVGGFTMWEQMSRRDDVQQIAQVMAREIALEGQVGGSVTQRLEDLKQLMNIDVSMDVEGDFIRGTRKLALQSDFTVVIYYHTEYGVGWINWGREKTYEARAFGTAEEYHK